MEDYRLNDILNNWLIGAFMNGHQEETKGVV